MTAIASRDGADRKVPPLAILVFMTMLGNLGLNMLVPAVPAIVTDLGTDSATAQWTLTIYLIGISVGQLIYGPLSDRFGRRPVMLAGLLLFLTGSLLAMLAPSVGLLILARVGQAMGGCAGMVLTRAIVRDVYQRERAASALGYISMTMVIGPATAPAIGGLLNSHFGWRAIPLALALICAAIMLASLRWLNETNLRPTSRIEVISVLRDYITLLRLKAYIGYSAAARVRKL